MNITLVYVYLMPTVKILGKIKIKTSLRRIRTKIQSHFHMFIHLFLYAENVKSRCSERNISEYNFKPKTCIQANCK